MKHLGDITKINGYEAPSVDVIIGGSPCQDLSAAGKRAGLQGDRSGLFMEQIRIIKEMREASANNGAAEIRPRYMVWENVPGAFSTNGGEDFRAVLEETVRIVDKDAVIPRPAGGKWRNSGCIVGDGFTVAWRVFDAQFWGVPQRRRRIALVADFGGETAPEILFERKGMQRGIEESGKERKRAAVDSETDIREAVFDISQRRDGVRCYKNISPTISALAGTGGNNVPLCFGVDTYNQCETGAVCYAVGNGQVQQTGLHKVAGALNCMHDQQSVINRYGVRRLTPLECERLQGFPDGWTDIGEWTDSKGKKHESNDSARYKALGNSIALPPWRWVLKRISGNYSRRATMASLFDGIGGFPLIWEEINGKGSCLWASEIEEFAIAVTKKRIG